MTHEEKKIGKIVEELTMYFFSIGAQRIQSCIERDGNDVRIKMEANYDKEYRDSLDTLVEYLNEPKNEGLEDYYWELAGSGDPGEASQLLLVGMMIDKADIHIGEEELSLVLYKHMEDAY